MIKPVVHFVGFRHDREYLSAVMVWGKPEYIHQTHDKRMYREVHKSDTIVLGSKGREEPSDWNSNDTVKKDGADA